MNNAILSVIGAARPLAIAGALAFGAMTFAATAHAAGDSGDSGTATTAQKCKEGEVWDPEATTLIGLKGKCVAEADLKKDETKTPTEKQGLIYDYGKSLAKAGDYEAALRVLAMAPDQDDPRVLNYMGYSNRKLGRMDVALGYYHAAIAKNPDFSLVREYLGEAYLQLGMLEKAREQLTEIERICGGRSCSEYGQLADLMVSAQTAN